MKPHELRTQAVGRGSGRGSESGTLRWISLRTPTLPPATHTNTVVLGRGRYWLVDPASPWPEEQAQLERAVDALADGGETLAGILLTHHHFDHVSGANALRASRGVPIAAHARTRDKLNGIVAVDTLLEDGDPLPLDDEWRVVLTPGHAPGHLCARGPHGVLVAGDMIAGIGTIVIEPDDDGDMREYLASLALLRTFAPSCLMPAHGEPILDADADAKLAGYIAHRLAREAKAQAALGAELRPLLDLVPAAYPDVAPHLYPLAARSLLAHLQKLEKDGIARQQDGAWALR